MKLKYTIQPSDLFYYDMQNFLISFSGLHSFIKKDKPRVTFELESVLNEDLSINFLVVHQNLRNQPFLMPNLTKSLTKMLILSCYNTAEDRIDRSKICEFFRHLRNACAHNNRFNFSKNEPCRAAAWRTLSIDHSHKGDDNPLHGKECVFSFIAPADIIYFLIDIQSHFATI